MWTDRFAPQRFKHPPLTVILVVLVISATPTLTRAGSFVQYQSGTESVRAYLAAPVGTGPFPAIIVIHEAWGLNSWIQEKTDFLAGQGYVTLAIDLYRGKTPSEGAEAHALMRGLPDARVEQDLSASMEYLKSLRDVKPNQIAVLGWQMGGGYALSMAIRTPALSACIVAYGRLVSDPTSIQRINCPILAIFGSDDRTIPSLSVMAFERACVAAGKMITVKIYPGVGQSFMDETNPKTYNVDATSNAWDRIFVFLATTTR